jgi:hypothetical protein
MESRSDSLAAELARLGLIDDYFAWCFMERPPFAAKREWLEKKGVGVSDGSLSRLHRSAEASQYRMAEAARAKASLSKILPKDMKLQIRRSLLDAKFNAVLTDLSHSELMDHLAAEQAEADMEVKRENLRVKKATLALTREKFEVETCEKVIEMHRDAKAREIMDRNLPKAETIAELRKFYFADVDAMQAAGSVKLPD